MMLERLDHFYQQNINRNSEIENCGIGQENRDNRIVGGRAASSNEFPWIAFVQTQRKDGRHFCGGSVISRRNIITAAHCVENQHGLSYTILSF